MDSLDELCVNTIRILSAECVQKANSGHPGLPMGASGMAYVLWTRFLSHNPANPAWFNRDRFVLSAGHGSMLLYSLLHLTGYDLSLEDLKNFRQWESKTPGHPEYGLTPGVETTTGPLGQGFANGVGMAMAECYLAARLNRPEYEVLNHYTYGIVSDGDLMEGVASEAASLAGHLKLGKLIYLYDDNHISIEGSTDLAFTEDRLLRFKAYGWHTEYVEDGNDLDAIESAIRKAQEETEQPSLIAVRTHIGFGSPNKQDTPGVHGSPLGDDELALTKKNLGWPEAPAFFIPEEAKDKFHQAVAKGRERERDWQSLFDSYKESFPDAAATWDRLVQGELPDDWERGIPIFPADEKGMATRIASGKVLNDIAPFLLNLVGGSADLAPSNMTLIKESDDFEASNCVGRNIRFGVREHAMGSILNGLNLHGGLVPFGGTFLIFSDYMRPAIRLAALMGLRVIYVFTHDSIGLGEDGPTHQPIEQLAALRAIPNLTVIRPCDANETAEAWRAALNRNDGPTALALTRQGLPTLDRAVYGPVAGLHQGAYVLKEADGSKPDAILIATGSEVHVALKAARKLEEEGVSTRVVSMPSWEVFEQQPTDCRDQVLPPEVKVRAAIEAGISQGWDRYAGQAGEVIGIDHFGASAPADVLFEKFGLTPERMVETVKGIMNRKAG
ncbi:MAG: transketolase [Deltaproteobacteria bacterium]|nr:transketolase [Deltaproteobacteria bacterium]